MDLFTNLEMLDAHYEEMSPEEEARIEAEFQRRDAYKRIRSWTNKAVSDGVLDRLFREKRIKYLDIINHDEAKCKRSYFRGIGTAHCQQALRFINSNY